MAARKTHDDGAIEEGEEESYSYEEVIGVEENVMRKSVTKWEKLFKKGSGFEGILDIGTFFSILVFSISVRLCFSFDSSLL